jgi:hypothetical protein
LPFHVLHYSPCFILLSSDNILLNSASTRGQAEKEFKVEVEAIGRVRHKNLVRLLGYCVEGAYRYVCWQAHCNLFFVRWTPSCFSQFRVLNDGSLLLYITTMVYA